MNLKKIVLSIVEGVLLSILCGCQTKMVLEDNNKLLPFSLSSKEEVHLSNPIFAYIFHSSDPDCSLFVYDQQKTSTLYPVYEGDSFFIKYVPLISSIISYNDSMVFFKINHINFTFSFEKIYYWQSSSLSSFMWPAFFDDVEYCTDRFFKLFLLPNLSEYENYILNRIVSHSNINDICDSWKTVLSSKDPDTWQQIISFHEYKVNYYSSTTKERYVLYKRLLSELLSPRHKPSYNNSLTFPFKDTTSSFLLWDSLFLYVPNNDNRQFLFSSEVVTKQQSYPFFVCGFNCYALQLEPETKIKTVSEKVYSNESGDIYKIPDKYNQRKFNIIMSLDTTRMEYYLTTNISKEIMKLITTNYAEPPTSYYHKYSLCKSYDDSVFIKGNRLVHEWLESR